MTDEQIIKALECCADEYIHSCDYCPFEKECNGDNFNLVKDALVLINRQKAEIERLKYNLEAVLNERADHSEAIKEFAESLHEKLYTIPTVYNSHFGRMVDNLVKEMVGDTE